MDFNATIDLIIKDLNDAYKIIDDFKSYNSVPELHIELAKAKCKSSAEIIALLKKSENITPKPQPENKKFVEDDILTIEKTVVEEKVIPKAPPIIVVAQPVKNL